MPCPFTGPKMLLAVPIFLCQTQNELVFVPAQNILGPVKGQGIRNSFVIIFYSLIFA